MKERYYSLDVFRGATVAFMIMVNNQAGTPYTPLDHAPWHGCTPTDLVFPFFLFAVGLGIQTLYLKLAGRAFTGFATVILLELIIGSLLMVSLGIIGEYLARIYEEVKGRPRYIVSESIEPDQ